MRDRIHFLVCFVQFESEEAGGCVINGTEIPNYRTIVAQDGWDWFVRGFKHFPLRSLSRFSDWGAKRGRPNESEYTVVKIDFYNNIRTYIADLRNTTVHSLEDLVAFNCDNDDVEGGTPGVHPAFASGQDGFLASLETRGVKDATHWQALKYLRRTAGKEGIDA
jgi:amidase